MKIEEIEVETELHSCKSCGYSTGFHLSFRRFGERLEVVLLCPRCEARYRVKWPVEVGV